MDGIIPDAKPRVTDVLHGVSPVSYRPNNPFVLAAISENILQPSHAKFLSSGPKYCCIELANGIHMKVGIWSSKSQKTSAILGTIKIEVRDWGTKSESEPPFSWENPL